MTHSTDKILFKQTILTLEYPLLNKHDLLETFKLYLNQLKPILDNNMIDSIIYFYNAFQEISELDNKKENKEEMLFSISLITPTAFGFMLS